ncbi:MAG: DUF1553 domain-containing protein [Verrucomicrobia bacterium]|nr:DUF1553 domain-containing protein [Verrucomicrobiota bacterium]
MDEPGQQMIHPVEFISGCHSRYVTRMQRDCLLCMALFSRHDAAWGLFRLVLLCFTLGPALSAAEAVPRLVDFSTEVRPLFAKHCTACHGGVKTAGKLSFLYREKALSKGSSGAFAVIPGEPDKSEVIRRVTSVDPDEVMPKPEHGPALSQGEVDVLRQWIRQGAPWSDHWSFLPPVEPARPLIRNKSWPKSTADAHVLAQLESLGLSPSPEATAAEWLRRVTLDLTGLPPSVDDFERFTEDCRSGFETARASRVDRLLASPAFGERWASVWLDLVRYSDTYGFEKDPFREIWPWRDWVIRAFNEGMSFDDFTIRQLAGDLLPNPSAEDLLATAFHRNTQNNTEGGTDDEEFRMAAVLDRVNTTWTTWNATTFGCVQCHAHPYDPFEKADYYRFAAFFNNTEDCDQNDDFPRKPFPNEASSREESLRLQRQAGRLREELNATGVVKLKDLKQWQPILPLSANATGGVIKHEPDGLIRTSGTLPIDVVYTLEIPRIPGATAFRIEILPDSDEAGRPPERGQAISKFALCIKPKGASNQVVKLQDVVVDFLAGPRDPRNVIQAGGGLGSYPVMTGRRWGVMILEKPLEIPEGAGLEIRLEHGIASNGGVQGCALRQFRLSYVKDPGVSEFARSQQRMEAWAEHARLKNRIKELGGPEVPVLVERSQSARRETRVFVRGNRLTLAESVTAGVPKSALVGSRSNPGDRLEMARWLVSDQNPFAARVLANRLWAEMFGRGIVETLEDFGTSGARPTRPELLDHLALRLKGELGWSVKAFLREIALSASYAQSARASAGLLERDPGNSLLARGPRSRLTAEMIRDQGLALSGLLSRKSFGPPVFPPQPEGIWNTVYSGEKWNTSTNEDRFRRAVYTYARRTAGYPLFITFDAPMRDVCSARRMASNTPLQALNTLNDPAFLEMAAALARRMEKAGTLPHDQIRFGLRLVVLDPPKIEDVQSLEALYRDCLKNYRANADLARQLGESPEHAALTLVANAILNLDLSLIR